MFAFLDALGAEFHAGAVGEASPLEVGLLAGNTGGVELGGTDTVRVAACAHPALITN